MIDTGSVDTILDFAIKEEEKAYDFYMDLSKRVKRPAMKEVFEGFAREEQGHREKLIKVKQGKLLVPAQGKVQDLKIADYVVDVEISANLEYQDALIVAMKKEKAAFRLYTELASLAKDENIRNLFQGLAQEEAKHKLRFEVEYDQEVYKEN